ncbi:MAG: thioredoxin family protein [Bacteroidales bacterium]|jgi:small redox-active disulfide protein 2|nr:thioredoxin family protein [Bacteroidales bacterium]
MEIKILGTGCASCKALYKNVEQAVKEMQIDAQVIEEQDLEKIMSYNIMSTPGLVIDEKVVAAGKKLNVSQVKELINKEIK